jgi:hypothetical protein
MHYQNSYETRIIKKKVDTSAELKINVLTKSRNRRFDVWIRSPNAWLHKGT